jgi:pyridoxal phosphate enzyme (YggS family)
VADVTADPPSLPVFVPLEPDRIKANLAAVRERIAAACSRAGRDASEVELLAATKYVPVDELGALADAGIGLVGENIAKDLEEKHARWGERFTFDFIGHLQSRKTKDVLPHVRLIHSVESESVLRQLERHARSDVRVLLEVNLAQEASKYGVDPGAVDSFLEQAERYEKISFAGLMTMPPLAADPEDARPYFSALRELAQRLARDWSGRHEFGVLSMGTSQDFEVAVEEGATVLRLGSVL